MDFKTVEGFSPTCRKIELIAGYFPQWPAIIYIPDNLLLGWVCFQDFVNKQHLILACVSRGWDSWTMNLYTAGKSFCLIIMFNSMIMLWSYATHSNCWFPFTKIKNRSQITNHWSKAQHCFFVVEVINKLFVKYNVGKFSSVKSVLSQ